MYCMYLYVQSHWFTLVLAVSRFLEARGASVWFLAQLSHSNSYRRTGLDVSDVSCVTSFVDQADLQSVRTSTERYREME